MKTRCENIKFLLIKQQIQNMKTNANSFAAQLHTVFFFH